MPTITVERRFCGPSDAGNGGYVGGLLAGLLGGPAEVTIRRPVPLARPLTVVRESGGLELRDDDGRVLARAESMHVDLEPPVRVTLAEAHAASASFFRRTEHPLPGCFVCGTERAAGDGLRIFPGPLSAGTFVVAAPWHPDPSLAGPDRNVRNEFLWAALDCTGAFAANEPPRGLMLLGRLAAKILEPLRAGEDAIVVGWPLADEGRKNRAGTALLRADGTTIAIARATWIFVEGPTGPAPWNGS